jgi:hypothetical protein
VVATQQVEENNNMGALDKERLTVVFETCRSGGASYATTGMTHAKLKALLLKCDIEPTTESTAVVRHKQRLTRLPTKPTIPTQGFI